MVYNVRVKRQNFAYMPMPIHVIVATRATVRVGAVVFATKQRYLTINQKCHTLNLRRFVVGGPMPPSSSHTLPPRRRNTHKACACGIFYVFVAYTMWNCLRATTTTIARIYYMNKIIFSSVRMV